MHTILVFKGVFGVPRDDKARIKLRGTSTRSLFNRTSHLLDETARIGSVLVVLFDLIVLQLVLFSFFKSMSTKQDLTRS